MAEHFDDTHVDGIHIDGTHVDGTHVDGIHIDRIYHHGTDENPLSWQEPKLLHSTILNN